MSAIRFLFWRKLVYRTRFWLLITGYDIKRRELSELLYGVYALAILFGWALVMFAFVVVYSTDWLAKSSLSPGALQSLIFAGFAAWLAVTPWLAQQSYDIYRFSLSDLDFLGSTPIRPWLLALSWFVRGLFTLPVGLFLLACCILASALMRVRHDSDVAGLALGLVSGISILVLARGIAWALGLLRYYARPRYESPAGTILSGLGIVLLVPLVPSVHVPDVTRFAPVSQAVFWPAWCASTLITGSGSPGSWALALLAATPLLALLAVCLVARGSLMAPAFEEGQLGGQLRRASAAGAPATGRRVQVHLARRLASGRGLPGLHEVAAAAEGAATSSTAVWNVRPQLHIERSTADASTAGAVRALLWKEWVRLRRLPVEQAVLRVLLPVALGALVAVGLALLAHLAHRFEVLAPATFFANYALLRLGANLARTDLSHADLFVGWPLSRSRMLLVDLLVELVPVGLSGEIALLVALATGLSGQGGLGWLWLAGWPALLAITAVAAFVEFRRLLPKWPGTASTTPEIGPVPILITGLVWLGAVYLLG